MCIRDRPAPEQNAVASRETVAPRSANEALVVDVFQDVLRRADIGVFDNFFDLGGHSLMATRLVVRIKHEMDVELALRNVFEKPELSQLAQHILDAQLAQFDPAQIAQLTEMVRTSAAGR